MLVKSMKKTVKLKITPVDEQPIQSVESDKSSTSRESSG